LFKNRNEEERVNVDVRVQSIQLKLDQSQQKLDQLKQVRRCSHFNFISTIFSVLFRNS